MTPGGDAVTLRLVPQVNIKVDRAVFDELARLAHPGESPNTVLRRALNLPVREQGRRSSVLKPFDNDGGKVAA